MAGASPNNPHVLGLRVAVQDEIAVPRILILADSTLREGSKPDSFVGNLKGQVGSPDFLWTADAIEALDARDLPH
jgi:hypothetical protein